MERLEKGHRLNSRRRNWRNPTGLDLETGMAKILGPQKEIGLRSEALPDTSSHRVLKGGEVIIVYCHA